MFSLVPTGMAVASLPLLALPAATSGIATLTTARTVHAASATLVASGAAVDLTTTITCPAGGYGTVYASMTQRSGHRIAQGAGQNTFGSCTGKAQSVLVRITPPAGSAVFRLGDAAVTVELFACGDDCSPVRADQAIDIRR